MKFIAAGLGDDVDVTALPQGRGSVWAGGLALHVLNRFDAELRSPTLIGKRVADLEAVQLVNIGALGRAMNLRIEIDPVRLAAPDCYGAGDEKPDAFPILPRAERETINEFAADIEPLLRITGVNNRDLFASAPRRDIDRLGYYRRRQSHFYN